jgi:hypothetical protein
MSKDEQAIEAEIQAKGLNAPRLSPEKIDAVITGEDYHVFPGTTLTVCCLKLRNGFTVTGESAAASPENFDVEIWARRSPGATPATRFGRSKATRCAKSSRLDLAAGMTTRELMPANG